MKKIQSAAHLLLGCLLVASCNQKEEARMPKQYTSEQLRNTVSIGAAGFSPDESKVLIDDNSTGIFNVAVLNISDTSIKPLTTSSKESFFAIDYLPGTDKFLFIHDIGGNENDHLYLMASGDTAGKDLTPWANSKNSFAGWSDDKKVTLRKQ
jgi:Tol biopolymer transport system component